MDNKKLKGIVDIFNDSGLTFMEINEKNCRIGTNSSKSDS